MDLSIIIVSYNTKNLLMDCLCTVEANRAASGMQTEVYVIDNGSVDGSVAAVRKAFPSVFVQENRANLGFTAANNRGLKFATGRYCLLLNPDTRVPVGAFDALLHVMDGSQQTAVCSPLLLNDDGSPQVCWARFQTVVSEITGRLDRSQSPYPLAFYADTTRRDAMRPFPVDWVGGACYLARRDAMHDAGLLDEGFFMYCEETEWCHRFARWGWQTLVVPSVTVTHFGGQSSKATPVETRRYLYRSLLRLYRILYGAGGAIAPSLIATARYAAYHVRNKLLPKSVQ